MIRKAASRRIWLQELSHNARRPVARLSATVGVPAFQASAEAHGEAFLCEIPVHLKDHTIRPIDGSGYGDEDFSAKPAVRNKMKRQAKTVQ